MLVAGLALGGCHDPLSGPVDLFHDLQGGEIAAQRPPPPGAGQPYPKLGSVPAKPSLPAASYRNGLAAQLAAERDRTEREAADAPLAPLPPPAAAAAPTMPALAGTTPPQAALPAGGAAPLAAATLATADAPAPPPARRAAPIAVAGAPAGPAPDAPLTIASDPSLPADLQALPPAPPPPATFEGIAAEPAPTPRVLPAGLAAPPSGTRLFFPEGSAVLPPSQTQTLREFLRTRGKRPVEVVGLGAAQSDTPDGQAAAIALALRRARAVATALEGQRVPATMIRLSANAFGRGVVLRLQ